MKVITGGGRLDADGVWHEEPKKEIEVEDDYWEKLFEAFCKLPPPVHRVGE